MGISNKFDLVLAQKGSPRNYIFCLENIAHALNCHRGNLERYWKALKVKVAHLFVCRF